MNDIDSGDYMRINTGRLCLAVAAALLLFSSRPLAAQGTKEAWQPASGLEDWDASIDLTPYAPGTYNFLVRARDKAGNVKVAPPVNVVVDPDSDLPRATIINPTPLLRVGGDLNVVGTCVDDDGVARVEVAIDSGDFVPAEGGGFWSLLMPTKDFPDGKRTVSVRGVDINGLMGPVTKVSFNLDHQPPVVTVDKPVAGILVAGAIQLEGRVEDANGVASLEISLDEGKTWKPVGLGGKPVESRAFRFPVDTGRLEDGPRIFRFRSVDGVGSKATSSYLLYVDNTKPALSLMLPSPDASVNGRFTVAGSVRDIVGVKSLAWTFDGQQGEIPLTKGDPYFSREFDAGPVKAGTAGLVLVATDEIGNQTRLAIAPRIDRVADRPVLTVSFPASGARVRPGALLWGGIRDDDGVSGFRWSLDGSPPAVVECGEVFSLAIADSSSGKHQLSLTPLDSGGLPGDAVLFPFILDRGFPAISFSNLVTDKAGSRPWKTGIEVKVDGGEFLEGHIAAPNPLALAEWAVGTAAPRKLELVAAGAGTSRFRVPLDRSLPYGFADIIVRAKDSMDNVTELSALLSVVDYGGIREDTGFRFVDERLGADGRMAFGPPAADGSQRALVGTFHREKLASVSLEPPTPLVTLSLDGELVLVEPKADGLSVPTMIRGKTERGHEFTAGPFTFATDSTAPALSLAEPLQSSWTRDDVRFSGSVLDPGGLEELSWRLLPSGEARQIEVPTAPDGVFSFAVPIADFPERGSLSVLFEARDMAGNSARLLRDFGVDVDPPQVGFVTPAEGAPVHGPEDVVARCDDASGIASVEYAADGDAFSPIEWTPGWFAQRVDLAVNPRSAWRVTDLAGNAWTGGPGVSIAPAPVLLPLSDSPAVEASATEARIELAAQAGARLISLGLAALSEADFLALPAGDTALAERFATRLPVNSTLNLKGQALFEGQLKAVSASLDNGATWLPLATVGDIKNAKSVLAFSLTLDAAKLVPGPGRVAVKIEDFAGTTWFAPIYTVVDRKGPELSVVTPAAGTLIPGKRFLALRSTDELGLASLEVTGGITASLDAKTGGAWYSLPLDPVDAKWQMSLTVTARDRAGNATVLPLKYGFDAVASAPRLVLGTAANPAEVLASGDLVVGTFTDDELPPQLKASVDGGESQVFTGGSFSLALPSLAPGKHRLTLTLVDRGGRSVEQRRDFVTKGAAPVFGVLEAVDKATRSPWRPGMALDTRNGMTLSGSLLAPNGLLSLEASVNGGTALKVEVGKASAPGAGFPFSLPLPASLVPDRTLVTLVAKDQAGLSSERRLEFHVIQPGTAGSDTADGLRFPATGIFSPIGDAVASISPTLLKATAVIEGVFHGRPLAKLALMPDQSLIAAGFEGTLIRLEAKGEGLLPEVMLQAETIDGDLFSWGPVRFTLDQDAPAVGLSSPLEGEWLRDRLRVAGTGSDVNGIVSVMVRLNEGVPFDLFSFGTATAEDPQAAAMTGPALEPTSADKKDFDEVIPLATVADGPVRVEVLVRDGAGRESAVSRFFNKDTLPPTLVQILPPPGETINGLTTVVVEAGDAGRLATAQWKPTASSDPEELRGLATMSYDIDFARLGLPLEEGSGFVVRDKAGNQSALGPDLIEDAERDKPAVQVLSPLDREVIRGDFSVSGFAFDDDGVGTLFGRIDEGEWKPVPVSGSSFSVPLLLADFEDNEHMVELYAEDIYGVRGDTTARAFRISKEEPLARMTQPAIDRPVRGRVNLEGSAADANGIKEIAVSVDNRTSFRTPYGTGSWSIPFDTRLVADGIHPVAIRPVDGYDIEGFYASMVGVDNTPPSVSLDLPRDGERVARELLVSGRVSDNLGLDAVRIEISPLGSEDPPLSSVDPGLVSVVRTTVDISKLPPGDYSVRIVAKDRALNETLASRSITVTGPSPEESVTLFFPAAGANLSGRAQIQGRAEIPGLEGVVTILVDGVPVGSANPGPRGWFSLELPAEGLNDGKHELMATARSPGGATITSTAVTFFWTASGPWIAIDTFVAGDFLSVRPWLRGKAGWVEAAAGTSTEASATSGEQSTRRPTAKELKAAAEALSPVLIEISLDNGLHFTEAEGTSTWKYRLETLDFSEGSVRVIVRATFGDGSRASKRLWYFLDKTMPAVEILEPIEGGHFNASLAVAGTAGDANGLESIEVALRKGDKKSYQMPTFIQGLYIDAQALGATLWQAGVGLTFLDDNVKLQAVVGQAPGDDANPQSFYGNVFGAKLIANLAYLPFSAFLGPDWAFLSTSFGLGANFTYFTQTQSGKGLIVGSVFGQIEFPKLTFDSLAVFKKFSLYTEFQVWVLSSVVSGGFIPRLSFGARVGVF